MDSNLDRDKKVQLRKELASKNNLSVKTLRRYERAFLEKGFAGLKPAERPGTTRLPQDFAQLMQEAIQLKREVPTRSVRQIIYILEMEGKAEPGVLKRSTVQDHLYAAGFGQKQMKKYNEGQKSSSKRFCFQIFASGVPRIVSGPLPLKARPLYLFPTELIVPHGTMQRQKAIPQNRRILCNLFKRFTYNVKTGP